MSPDFRAQLQEALAPAYELERELSGGGMSRVFVAVEARLKRRVVVKVLPPELAAGVNAERFRREIQLAAQLHHPHIVPLLSAGESGNILYYTMPFIEGESLRSALRKRGRLAVGEVARVLHDVVDALAYAHARGVVHRDIKPDNVLLSGKHAVVTDFGVAKALGSALVHHTTSGVTTAGVAIGTPAYMAPEQLAGDPAADHRVDLYAVGLLAYELLTGDSPFTGPSPQATMAAQLTRVPTALHECCPDVPQDLSDVVMRCLAKNPDERPQTAEALLDELVAVTTPQGGMILGGITRPSGTMLGAAEGVTTPRTPVTPPATAPLGAGATTPVTPATPARRRVLRGAVAALVVLVAAGAFALTTARRERPARADSVAAARPAAGAPDTTRRAAAVAGADSTIHARARLAGAATLDSGPRRAIVLSRAESVAIADAVRKRMEAEQRQAARKGAGASAGTSGGGPGAAAGAAAGTAVGVAVDEAVRVAAGARVAQPSIDSLRVEFQRILADSIRTALEALRRSPAADVPPNVPRTFVWTTPGAARDSNHLVVAPILAPPRGERRRVVVMSFQNSTGRPELAPMVAKVGDSLRAEFIGRRRASTEHSQEYEMVDAPTTRAAEQRALNPVAVGFTLRADYVVHGVTYLRRDSVRVLAQVLDVRAGRVLVSYTGGSAPLDAPFGKVPVLAERMDEKIEQAIARAIRDEERRREAQARAHERALERDPRTKKPLPKERVIPPG